MTIKANEHLDSANGAELVALLEGRKPEIFGTFVVSGEPCIRINANLSESVIISNFTFEHAICFQSGTFSSIEFRDVVFKGKLILAGGTFEDFHLNCCTLENHLIINDVQFSGKFILHATTTEEMRISGCSFSGEPRIYGGPKQDFEFENNTTLTTFDLSLFDCRNIVVKNVTGYFDIKKISIGSQLSIDSGHIGQALITVTRSDGSPPYLSLLKIGSIGKNTVLRLHSLRVMDLLFEEAWILGSVSLTDISGPYIRGEAKFQVFDSDLGSTRFNNCDFGNFQVLMKNALIANCIFSGTQLPKAHLINRLYGNHRREAFAQLKKIADATGDTISAGRYRAHELEGYQQSLRWSANFQEKSVLYLNKLSNQHNQQWLRPLLLLLLTTSIFYVLYCRAVLAYPAWKELGSYRHMLNYFLEFMNPLHSSTFIPSQVGVKIAPGESIIWENLHRIVASFLIYQFVQAFRKHGRSV